MGKRRKQTFNEFTRLEETKIKGGALINISGAKLRSWLETNHLFQGLKLNFKACQSLYELRWSVIDKSKFSWWKILVIQSFRIFPQYQDLNNLKKNCIYKKRKHNWKLREKIHNRYKCTRDPNDEVTRWSHLKIYEMNMFK